MSASEPAAREVSAPVIWVIEANPDHREVICEVLIEAVSGARVVSSGIGQEEVPELAAEASLIVADVETPSDLLALAAAPAGAGLRPPLLLTCARDEDRPPDFGHRFPAAAVLDKSRGASFVAELAARARELLAPGEGADPAVPPAPELSFSELPSADLFPFGRALVRQLRESLEQATARLPSSPPPPGLGGGAPKAGLQRALALAGELEGLLADGDEDLPRTIDLEQLLRAREPLWEEWTKGRLGLDWQAGRGLDWRADLPVGPFMTVFDRVLIDAWRRGGGVEGLTLTMEDLPPDRIRLRVGMRPEPETSPPPAGRAAFGPLRAMARLLGGRASLSPRGAVELVVPRHGEEAAGRPAPAVLIVDDDATLRRIASECVERAGARPCEAECGEQAVELYEAGCRYGLVLLDLNLGGLNGLSTARQLRRIDPRALVLLCSAKGQAMLGAAAAAGVTGMVAKPFGASTLTGAIRGLLGLPPSAGAPPRLQPRQGRGAGPA